MAVVLLVVLFCTTSILAAAMIGIASPAAARSTWRASGRLLEFAGLWTVFHVVNLALGLLVILALRGLAHVFVSVYVLNDVSVVVVSALQAFFVHARLSRAS